MARGRGWGEGKRAMRGRRAAIESLNAFATAWKYRKWRSSMVIEVITPRHHGDSETLLPLPRRFGARSWEA